MYKLVVGIPLYGSGLVGGVWGEQWLVSGLERRGGYRSYRYLLTDMEAGYERFWDENLEIGMAL
ncbi:MAG: hypothetical protein R2865_13040 [Deinococcales bacterium]